MEADDTLEHILFLARRFDRKRIRHVVIMILLELHIPTQCSGFELLVMAIVLCIENPKLILHSSVFEAVARMCGGFSAKQVEQAIRRAIDVGWDSGDDAPWQRYFPPEIGGEYVRPSNMVFVTKIARVVELWTGCREAYADTEKEAEVASR